MDDDYLLAIDVGGTKLAAALTLANGAIAELQQIPTQGTDVAGLPSTPEDRLALLVRKVLRAQAGRPKPVAVGIACAGPVDEGRGTVSPINIPAWRDFDVVSAVAAETGSLPTRLVGDALAAAMGEHWLGAGRGARVLLAVVVSTGIGGGLLVEGLPLYGATGNAGHIGHMPVSLGEKGCACGAERCLESVSSGPSMVRWARGRGWIGADAADLAADAKMGAPVAVAAMQRGGAALGEAIAGATALLDLDRLVIGGAVSEAGEPLLGPLRAELSRHCGLAFMRKLTIAPMALGRDAGLIGAAHAAASCVPGSGRGPADEDRERRVT